MNWATLFRKLSALLQMDYDRSKDVASIPMPVLMVFADADSLRHEHIVEFFGLICEEGRVLIGAITKIIWSPLPREALELVYSG